MERSSDPASNVNAHITEQQLPTIEQSKDKDSNDENLYNNQTFRRLFKQSNSPKGIDESQLANPDVAPQRVRIVNERTRSLRRSDFRRTPIYNEQILYQDNDQQAKNFWLDFNRTYFEKISASKYDDLRRALLKYEIQGGQIEAIFRDFNYLSNFRNEVVLELLPELKQDTSVRMLIASKGTAYLLFYNCEVVPADNDEQPATAETVAQQSNFPAVFYGAKQIRKCSLVAKEDYIPYGFQLRNTLIIDLGDCYERMIKYTKAFSAMEHYQQIDREIDMWLEELAEVQNSNTKALNRLQIFVENDRPFMVDEKELERIDEALIWSDILKHFREGHTDKTDEIFESYKIDEESEYRKTHRPSANKGKNKHHSKFETDCKICFCSSNDECNKVLYCDDCNTSFHQHCYGLAAIPKSQTYFCDTCTEYKDKSAKDKPWCKICEKRSFPMKKIDGHFYHVTCLVLNNFVEMRDRQLKLKKGIDFQFITKKVVESELRQGYCQYCVHQVSYRNGIQIGCQWPGCTNTFHPICAYLYGCSFRLDIVDTGSRSRLNVRAYCNNHEQNRNFDEQIYFRRYVCNYKKTSERTREEYLQEFLEEQKVRQKHKLQQRNFKDVNMFRVTAQMKQYWNALKEESFKKCKTETSKLIERSRKATNN